MTTKKALVLIVVIGILLAGGAFLAVKALDNKIASSHDKIVTRYEDDNGRSYYKITPSVANAYLLPIDEGYLMIDTGYPEDMQIVFDALSEEGVELSQIKYLFITHSHDDHAGFAAALKEKSGCRLILPEQSLSDLARGTFDWQGESVNLLVDISSRIYNFVNQRTFSFEPVLPTEDDIILSGNRASLPAHWDLQGAFIHTPGHSADSWSLVLQDGRAFVGDAAMNMLNLLGTGKRPIFMENRSEVYESFEKIKQEGATILFTGHGLPIHPAELPMLRDRASTGPGFGALLPYLGRLVIGIVLIVSFFLLAAKTELLMRIICYILAFILMRDLMTPFGFWTIFSDPVFGIRFAADPLLLGVLAFGSLALSLTIIRIERGLPKQVPLIDGQPLVAIAFGLLGSMLIIAPVVFFYRGIGQAERGGAVPLGLIPMILFLALCGNLLEELLFRGYLLHWLRLKDLSKSNAALASGLFFAICHLFLAFTVTDAGLSLILFVLWEGIICALLAMKFGLVSAVLSHGIAIGVLASI